MPEITMYTTSWCGECRTVKRYLEDLGLAYDEVDIEAWEAPRDTLEELTGNRTVPQIVVDGRVLGGYADFLELMRSGKAEAALKGER